MFFLLMLSFRYLLKIISMSKVIFITGASSGIGKSIATYLHNNKYTVYGTSRNPDKLKLPFAMVALDVTDEVSIKEAIEKVIAKEEATEELTEEAKKELEEVFESQQEKKKLEQKKAEAEERKN